MCINYLEFKPAPTPPAALSPSRIPLPKTPTYDKTPLMKITGGEFRGRPLQTPKSTRTRPTQSRLREALFSSLQTRLPEANVLDLFAGSGALAIEALSRGAAKATLVESAAPAIRAIRANLRALRLEGKATLIPKKIEALLKAGSNLEKHAPFDIILADPPYASGWETRLLEQAPWQTLLAEDGVLAIEWGSQHAKKNELPESPMHLVKVREKSYGETVLTTYERRIG